MDPFTEKDLIECLKSIAVSLRNMDTKMDEMTQSLREIAAAKLEEDLGEAVIEDEPIA